MYGAEQKHAETRSKPLIARTAQIGLPSQRVLLAATLLLSLGCSAGGADGSDGGATGSPSAVVVNEVYPHGSDPLTNPDWVELKNTGSAAVDVSSFRVRDSKITVALPAGTIIAAGGYLVLYCDDSPDGGASDRIHLPFKLGSADQFHFLDPTGVRIDGASWDALTAPFGKSYGRNPDGTGQFTALTPTRAGRNL